MIVGALLFSTTIKNKRIYTDSLLNFIDLQRTKLIYNMMTTMMGRRISQTVVCILWGVVALVALSHSTAEATVNIHTQSLRRLPTQKVRGSRRDLGTGEKSESKSKGTGVDKTIRVAPGKSIETVTRPAMVSGLDKLNGNRNDIAPAPESAQPKLPESPNGSDIKVNKTHDNSRGNSKTNAPKVNEATIPNGNGNEHVIENGAEHFQAGENLGVI